MARTDHRSLRKLIGLQKLGAARLELALAAGHARKAALEAERRALIAMQDRRYDGGTIDIDPSLLIRRLGVNALESDQLESRLESERKALLQDRRRVGILEDRLEEARGDEARRELGRLIEELMSRKTPDNAGERD